MFPAFDPGEVSTAREGDVLTRSFPRTWSMVKNGGVMSFGALHVLPLLVERANAMLFPKETGKRRQTTYALLEPLPANRGTEDCPSAGVAATTRRVDHVGGFPVSTLSEKVVEISTLVGVKFVQLIRTRPVSGSTSMNSLSAASAGSPPINTRFGFVAAVTSNGPAQVCPQSVER